MKRKYDTPFIEIEEFLIKEDILFDPSRIPDDGEIDDEDLFS